MSFSAIERDGSFVVVDGSAATDANGTDCMCWRQAKKCITDEATDFWAHTVDIGSEYFFLDNCFYYWGLEVLCLPEGATVGDLGDIEELDECNGYRQAVNCLDSEPVDRWILASEAEEGFFRDGDDCLAWGGLYPCLPEGATLGSAPSRYFETCEECQDYEPVVCPACFGGRTPQDFTITLDGITACNLCLFNNTKDTGSIDGVTLTLPYVDTFTDGSGTYCRYYLSPTPSGIRHRFYSGGSCTGATPTDTSEMIVYLQLKISGGVATYAILVGPYTGFFSPSGAYFLNQGSLPAGWCEDDIGGSNANTTCAFLDINTHATGGTAFATPNF